MTKNRIHTCWMCRHWRYWDNFEPNGICDGGPRKGPVAPSDMACDDFLPKSQYDKDSEHTYTDEEVCELLKIIDGLVTSNDFDKREKLGIMAHDILGVERV